AHYPLYMKRAGDWEHRLAPSELDALLRSLADKGVLDFDASSVRAAARASTAAADDRARAARQPIAPFQAARAAPTGTAVAIERYVPPEVGASEVRALGKAITWTGLANDAEQHSDVPALGALAAAERELRALREHPGFTRIR